MEDVIGTQHRFDHHTDTTERTNAPDEKHSTATFSAAFSRWEHLYNRYRALRNLSDLEWQEITEKSHLSVSGIDHEVEKTECALEDATECIVHAPKTPHRDMSAVLFVLLHDLTSRHQITRDDLSIRLIVSAWQALNQGNPPPNAS